MNIFNRGEEGGVNFVPYILKNILKPEQPINQNIFPEVQGHLKVFYCPRPTA